MKKRIALAGAGVAVIVAVAAVALVALPGRAQAEPEVFAQMRQATAPYLSLEPALADGYGELLHCLSDPQAGAMGYHYVNGALVGDDQLDVLRPEALVYQRLPSGELQLGALEYIIFYDVWHADPSRTTPPELLGQTFELKTSLVEYGVPPFYELHVWLWEQNPSGVFADWNPRVSCP
jgi:hypothetical protein